MVIRMVCPAIHSCISLLLLKTESLDNAIYPRALIGLAIMVHEPL